MLVVAGSREMPGAALLAATAALRAGAGKLTIAAPERVAQGLALALPEARVIGLAETRGRRLHGRRRRAPGADRSAGSAPCWWARACWTRRAAARFVARLLPLFAHAVVVLDALAMAVVRQRRFRAARDPDAARRRDGAPERPDQGGDLRRSRWRRRGRPPQRWNALVALKGAQTLIADARRRGLALRRRRHAGLATSGSGDMLAGLIGGLAARGLPPVQAAGWGVLLHGRAGEALARRQGPLGYLAREIAAEVPALIHAIGKRARSKIKLALAPAPSA